MHREKSIALLMVAALLLAPFPLPTTATAVPEPAAAALPISVYLLRRRLRLHSPAPFPEEGAFPGGFATNSPPLEGCPEGAGWSTYRLPLVKMNESGTILLLEAGWMRLRPDLAELRRSRDSRGWKSITASPVYLACLGVLDILVWFLFLEVCLYFDCLRKLLRSSRAVFVEISFSLQDAH
jgi:hypothetical protein